MRLKIFQTVSRDPVFGSVGRAVYCSLAAQVGCVKDFPDRYWSRGCLYTIMNVAKQQYSRIIKLTRVAKFHVRIFIQLTILFVILV